MKILWIDPVNSDPQFLNALALALARDGNEVVICSNRRDGFEPPDIVIWKRFAVVKRIPRNLGERKFLRAFLGLTYPLGWIKAVLVAKLFAVKKILISTNLVMPFIDALAVKLLRMLGVKSVVIVHKPYYKFFNDHSRVRAPKYRQFYKSVSNVIVMADFSKRVLQEMYDLPDEVFIKIPHFHFSDFLSRYRVLPELDSKIKEWASSNPIVGYISTPTDDRGINTFLLALPTLKSLLPDVRIIILSSHKAPVIERTVKEHNMETQCWIQCKPYGYDELVTYLSNISVMVVPYRFATQSGVVAMSFGFGIPVVATSVGGLPEMVIAGYNGELVPPDSSEMLAKAIFKILQPEAIIRYKRNAKEYAQKNLSTKVWTDVLKSILE